MDAIEENIRLRAALENAEQFIDLYIHGISSIDDAKHTLAHIQSALYQSREPVMTAPNNEVIEAEGRS